MTQQTDAQTPVKFWTRKALYDYVWRVLSTLTAALVTAAFLALTGVIKRTPAVIVTTVLGAMLTLAAVVWGFVVTVIEGRRFRERNKQIRERGW